MYNLLTSIVLCLLANAAAAQCVAGTTAPPAQVRSGAGLIRTSAAMPDDSAPRRKADGGDSIRTAATGSREVPAMRRPTAASNRPKVDAGSEEQPRRTGPAMLLAAVAVMTAIALRRSGASGR